MIESSLLGPWFLAGPLAPLILGCHIYQWSLANQEGLGLSHHCLLGSVGGEGPEFIPLCQRLVGDRSRDRGEGVGRGNREGTVGAVRLVHFGYRK